MSLPAATATYTAWHYAHGESTAERTVRAQSSMAAAERYANELGRPGQVVVRGPDGTLRRHDVRPAGYCATTSEVLRPGWRPPARPAPEESPPPAQALVAEIAAFDEQVRPFMEVVSRLVVDLQEDRHVDRQGTPTVLQKWLENSDRLRRLGAVLTQQDRERSEMLRTLSLASGWFHSRGLSRKEVCERIDAHLRRIAFVAGAGEPSEDGGT